MDAKPQAFLFDLNGTMIDDMQFHLEVWYDILNNDLGANLSADQVRGHMYGKNHEVLVRIFGADRFTEEESKRISWTKEVRYQELYRPYLELLPGLDDFLRLTDGRGIRMAIGSAAIPFNIDFVIDNLKLRNYFPVVVSAEDVAHSKPHPETYLKAAALLKVEPSRCVVFEDAPKGVEAALNAGMQSVVILNMHRQEEFAAYPNVSMFISDYNDPGLQRFVNH